MVELATASIRPTSPETCRVMLVDDSAVIRSIFRRTLEADPEIRVVASVGNGQLAIDAVKLNDPDVIVLDIEMPVMDGMTALPKLLAASPSVKIIMASTLTRENAEVSLKALAAGATDYIPKPSTHSEIASAENFRRELLEKVKELGRARRRSGRPAESGEKRRPIPAGTAQAVRPRAASAPIQLRAGALVPPQVLAIGSSTGGPQALIKIVESFRDGFSLPILITQHMPKAFTAILAEHLAKVVGRPAAEARDDQPVVAGGIYVAPGDYHMEVHRKAGVPTLKLTRDPPVNFCRPAVDPMLDSAVQVWGQHVLACILTGMGHDGCAGGRSVVAGGGTVIAQDEATSVVWGMPGAVAQAGLCSAVLPITEIGPHIRRLAGKMAS